MIESDGGNSEVWEGKREGEGNVTKGKEMGAT